MAHQTGAGMLRLLPAQNVIHQPCCKEDTLPRIAYAKQDEEKVNKLIITEAFCNAIDEALHPLKKLGHFSLVYQFKN